MNEDYLNVLYLKIIEALRLVAAPAEVQTSLLPDFVCKPDEVALTFDETIVYAKILLENNFISEEQFNGLVKMNCNFDNFTQKDWTIDSMSHADSWKQSRESAKEALKVFKEKYATPNLFWIHYVKNQNS